ncbi:MAG: beta-lactamase family protein [Alphaproteobacteria bacterium]|nr:beta-lactamase family protein [Alphaproteobacteria bacterium]
MKQHIVGLLMCGMAFGAVQASDMADTFSEKTVGQGQASFYVLGPLGAKAERAGTALDHTTPVRIASVTKTYVAGTVLRLMEEGMLDISRPISAYIDPTFDALLRADGYDTSVITVKHLLSHTAGLVDHTNGEPFFATVLQDPTHHWTREEQIKGAVDWLDPLGKPGAQYIYSDTGYVLLGDMIERLTGLTLAAAVRAYMGLDALGLENTYWEIMEVNKAAEAQRAHQYLQGQDTHGWSASLDLYGGGGLVSTTQDMAAFFAALFEGKVFKKPETLDLMLSEAGLPEDSPYRLGVFERQVEGVTFYEHSGFWGTVVMYVPSTGRAYAGAVQYRKNYGAMRQALVTAIGEDR